MYNGFAYDYGLQNLCNMNLFDATIISTFSLSVPFYTTAGNIHLEPQLLHYSEWQKMKEA